HCLDILASVPPIPLCIEIAQTELACQAQLNFCNLRCNFPGYKLKPPPRRLMVEENARAGKDSVCLPVVLGEMVPGDFGNCVGRTRMERGFFILGTGARFAEHFARASKIEFT